MEIKYIYFDVGGVEILDFYKTNKWDQMLDDLGLKGNSREEFSLLFDKTENDICKGKDVDILVPILRGRYGLKLDGDYSLLSDFVSRFEKNELLAEVIYNLQGKIKMGLLTNMYPGMLDLIKKRGLLPHIKWDNIIDSSIVRLAKPDKEIFDFALKESGEILNNILFIENSKENSEAANRYGWNTLLYDPLNISGSNNQLLSMLGL